MVTSEEETEEEEIEIIKQNVRGFLKWFNFKNQYGFVRNLQNEEFFVHGSGIILEPEKWQQLLIEDQDVTFDIGRSGAEIFACNLIILHHVQVAK